MPLRALRALALVLVLVALVGCGSSKGRKTVYNQAHNLVVDNYDDHYAIDVSVDGVIFGKVPADGRGYFWIAPGYRQVVFISDEKLENDAYRRQCYGTIEFFVDSDVRLSYVP
jgi:hypothetical protein